MVNGIRTIYPMDEIKGLVQSSLSTSEFDKEHPKKAERYIGRNVVNMNMKTIVPILW